MKKKINYHYKSTLYIPVKCTMQQSVNGNIKRKNCDDKEVGVGGGSAGNKASATVSAAVSL